MGAAARLAPRAFGRSGAAAAGARVHAWVGGKGGLEM